MTDNEIKIVNNSIGCTLGLFAYFLLYTGLRKSEALALRYKDIDFENKIIVIDKSLYYENNAPKVKTPKTHSGVRSVILLDNLIDKIPKLKKNDLLFTFDGDYIKNSMFTRKWKCYQNETGLKITAHQLRHTFATILFEANINVKDAQIMMGHSDVTVTQNIYTHIRQNRLNDTSIALNNHVEKNVSKAD